MLKSNNPALHHLLWHMEKMQQYVVDTFTINHFPYVGRSFSSFTTSSQNDTAWSRRLLWSALTMRVLLCYWNFYCSYIFHIHTT